MSERFTNEMHRLSESDIDAFEKTAGQSIPEAYRAHLLTHNGGRPERTTFDFTLDGARNGDDVQGFLGIGDGSFGLSWKLGVYANRFPRDLFPIASTPFGNLVLLARDDSPRAGQVFFWDHDNECEEDEEPDDRNVHWVAPSFAAFLASLHE